MKGRCEGFDGGQHNKALRRCFMGGRGVSESTGPYQLDCSL